MEINKTKLKDVAEVLGPVAKRDDMRLAVMLVKRALASRLTEDEVPTYAVEDVLPQDVRDTKPKVVDVVKAALDKLSAENARNDVERQVRSAMRAAQVAAKDARMQAEISRDAAVWKLKRLLYVDGGSFPEAIPED